MWKRTCITSQRRTSVCLCGIKAALPPAVSIPEFLQHCLAVFRASVCRPAFLSSTGVVYISKLSWLKVRSCQLWVREFRRREVGGRGHGGWLRLHNIIFAMIGTVYHLQLLIVGFAGFGTFDGLWDVNTCVWGLIEPKALYWTDNLLHALF